MNTFLQVAPNQGLLNLHKKILEVISLKEKLQIIEQFLERKKIARDMFWLQERAPEEQYVLLALSAIGQEAVIDPHAKGLELLIDELLLIEKFYREIGGIIGYHISCLSLLKQKSAREKRGIYHRPKAKDISKCTPAVSKHIVSALRNLPLLAEMYPVGGAADRLSLRDEETGAFQIAATLEFAEKSLLERLIEDLQAREYLYWKLFGEQITVPVALMSSQEKNGTAHLKKMLEEKNWFGRSKESFFLFSQPLVPSLSPEGDWCKIGANELLLKPGGHGVIWKLARESGVLDWLKKQGKTKALMRQINNLVAGVDFGLLAFLGVGFSENKDFGFAACPREKGTSEGVNVVIETNEGYCLTNIEYCDFEHFQVNDDDLLANTNLLFVDLTTVEDLLEKCPIPGMLVNAKKVKYRDRLGMNHEKEMLRLESTMQNVADALIEKEMQSRTFITLNKRKKTISPVKKEFAFGSSMKETPEDCYLTFLENAKDLLENYCGFELPSFRDSLSFFVEGPPFIFLYHSALGPQYAIIAKKLRAGRLAMGSELKLQIADLDVEGLDVDGSLHIVTDAILGHRDEKGKIQCSNQTGKCVLKNVRVRNLGIHQESSRSFWKDEIVHRERCEIWIEEGGEFFACDVILRGDLCIKVPSGVKVCAYMNEGKLEFTSEVLKEPSWQWNYTIGKDDSIELTK